MPQSHFAPPPVKTKRRFRAFPPRAIALSFACMILAGTGLLCLPIASQSGQSVGFVNALFTATSANCVTGLVVVNTAQHWTLFGQIVILLLIQLGGLGLVSVLTVGLVLLRHKISLENRLLIQAAFNQDNIGGMVRLVRMVIKITLCFEGAGAVLLAAGFYFTTPGIGLGRAIYYGIFHSISAFCNAGFDVLGPNSLVPYQGNVLINLVIMALIVCGGLGFTVWSELFYRSQAHPRRRLRQKWWFLSLHTKMVLLATGVLLLAGAGLILAFEWHNPDTLGPLPVPQKILAALFQSVTLRTAGFASVDQGALTAPSTLLSSLLMIIGGSPAGTAGGIKTVTIGIILVAMVSGLRGRRRLEAFGRTLPLDALQKALTVAVTFLLVVVLATFVLYFTESGNPFEHTLLDLFYEVSSAAGTVGLTTGITPHLSIAGRLVAILCMYLGRIGPVTAVIALSIRLKKGVDSLHYPSENVIIG